MQVMNPNSRPVDVGGGRVLAPGEHADLNSKDPRVARLLDRGTLRRVRSRPAAQPEPQPITQSEPAGDQEVDQ